MRFSGIPLNLIIFSTRVDDFFFGGSAVAVGSLEQFVGFEFEQFGEGAVGEFGEEALALVDDFGGEGGLVLDHVVDAVFEGAAADEFVHHDAAGLADAEGAIGGLVLDGGVPPAVVVEDVRGAGEVEAEAAGFEREDEGLRDGGGLEVAHHGVARGAGDAAVEVGHVAAEGLAEVLREQVAHLGVLREDERAFAAGEDFFELLFEAREFAGAFRFAGDVAEVLLEVVGGVVADLFEAREGGEDEAAPADAFGGLQLALEGGEFFLIEFDLFERERAVDFRLQFFGEVGDDLFVGLQAAQDEGRGDAPQACARAGVGAGLDGPREQVAEHRAFTEDAGVEEIHDGPQIADVVFDGGAGEGDAVVGGQRARRLRLARLGVLDVLRFVEQKAGPFDLAHFRVVAVKQIVAGNDDVHLLHLARERLAVPPQRAVVQMDPQAGREALRLAHPISQHRHRPHNQRRPARAARLLVKQQRQRLNRLAETHVVRETRTETAVAQVRQPTEPAQLIRPQLAREIARWWQHAERVFVARQAVEQVAHPAMPARRNNRQTVTLVARAEHQAHRIQRRFCFCRAATSADVQCALKLTRIGDNPATSEKDKRRISREQRFEFFGRHGLAIERDVQADVHASVGGERRIWLLIMRRDVRRQGEPLAFAAPILRQRHRIPSGREQRMKRRDERIRFRRLQPTPESLRINLRQSERRKEPRRLPQRQQTVLAELAEIFLWK